MTNLPAQSQLCCLSASKGSRFSTDGMHRLQLSTTSQRHQIEYSNREIASVAVAPSQ